ncbi:hypothetical protein GRI33_13205 [Brucella sp. BO3]|uniref:hypothetical protein n=1 Tax=unclassified Brucella TaxID=2632610 RepID=UPI00159EF5DC|nr:MULTISPECIES: hypothetical protein [unclassified Brucella]QMV27904.1 hypothetical protein GRI33_13205 [Brucella sp. BO3]
MSRPTDTEIRTAIEYALRHHPLEEEVEGDEGSYVNEITDVETLLPFVNCLLSELGVI